LNSLTTFIKLEDEIEHRAAFFITAGIQPMDALHLASAESANVDYFYTCDDRFLKKAKQIEKVQEFVVSPLELITKLES